MKINQIQKILFFIVFIGINFSFSQEINNNLQGYYVSKSPDAMYSSFEFDGNGKVSIVGMELRDYFTKGDSLIIYPDKSIFKFKIQKNKLIGASSWVEKETWIKKDTLVPNNRKDDSKAKKTALLMNEYYKISGDKSSFDFLGDNAKATIKKDKINQLCNQGLSKACLDYFGMLVIEDQGLMTILNSQKSTKPENPAIVTLAIKIIAQGETEGYAVLGSYYYMIGNKQKAMQLWKIGEQKGDSKSAMALFNIGLEEALDKIEPEKEEKKVTKKVTKKRK